LPSETYGRLIAPTEPPVSTPPAGNGRGHFLAFPSGDTVRILVDSGESSGSMTVLDCTHVAGPTERHSHTDAHKSVFVLSGRYRFVVGDEQLELGAGDNVFIGRGVPHDFVVGIEGGRALFVFSPGGVEEYFRALAVIVDADASWVHLEGLRRRYHIEPPTPAPAVEP
jgi:quercetin dioxygenase-like cupin family protein